MHPIVSTEWLSLHLHDPNLVIVDVRWQHGLPLAGYSNYLSGRISGAVFLDLDADLSDRSKLRRGRHPLPQPARFVETLARVGIGRDSTVVAYDDVTGSHAARLWWMLKWIRHENVAVLDGGITKWIAEGRELVQGEPPQIQSARNPIVPVERTEMVAELSEIEDHNRRFLLIDARAGERFRGEVEPIDARAGHIPNAINAPYMDNLTTDPVPVFRSPAELRLRFEEVGVRDGTDVVCYCGSGVTACHDIIALEIAGFSHSRLFPGSWSEWIANFL